MKKLKKYIVSYYYLATGMEGVADTYNKVVKAKSKKKAIEKLIREKEPTDKDNQSFLRSCLTATKLSNYEK